MTESTAGIGNSRTTAGITLLAWLLLPVFLGCAQKTSHEDRPAAQSPDRPGSAETNSRSELPNVLIIGDSISIGYTPFVQELLKGRANVVHPNANCGDTRRGLKSLAEWLGDTHWDVIHFNWGLHDLCYRNPNAPGSRDKVNGAISVPLADYEANLDRLASQLERTGARLIWGSTTVVPDGEGGRVVGDDVKYNNAAARVMKAHRIPVNDLHALTKTFAPELFVGPGNVHYTKEGYRRIATQVVASVDDTLKTLAR